MSVTSERWLEIANEVIQTMDFPCMIDPVSVLPTPETVRQALEWCKNPPSYSQDTCFPRTRAGTNTKSLRIELMHYKEPNEISVISTKIRLCETRFLSLPEGKKIHRRSVKLGITTSGEPVAVSSSLLYDKGPLKEVNGKRSFKVDFDAPHAKKNFLITSVRWQSINHPHVNPLLAYDVYYSEIKRTYKAIRITPLCLGGSLHDFLKKYPNLTELDRWEIHRQMAIGLQAIHTKYVYNDMKLANTLVSFKPQCCPTKKMFGNSSTSVSRFGSPPNQEKPVDISAFSIDIKLHDLESCGMKTYNEFYNYGTFIYTPPYHVGQKQFDGESADLWGFGVSSYQIFYFNNNPTLSWEREELLYWSYEERSAFKLQECKLLRKKLLSKTLTWTIKPLTPRDKLIYSLLDPNSSSRWKLNKTIAYIENQISTLKQYHGFQSQ